MLPFDLYLDISDVYSGGGGILGGFRGTVYQYKKTEAVKPNTKYIDPYLIKRGYFGRLELDVKQKTGHLSKSDLEEFNDKWNSKPLMAKITKNIEDSDTDKILTFKVIAEKYEKNKLAKSKSIYERKETEKINLYGPSFNKEIDEKLAEINTKPAAQANVSTTGKNITNTKVSGIGTVEI